MPKNIPKYSEILIKKHFSLKQRILLISKVLGLSSCVCICIVLLAPLFNIQIFHFEQHEYSTAYYVIYTPSPEPTRSSAVSMAQNLRVRGAGGNIIDKDESYYIAITITKDVEEAQKIIKNLYTQEIDANYMQLDIKIDTHILKSKKERDIYLSLYKYNIKTINAILDCILKLDISNITDTDASINIFELYTEYQTTLYKLDDLQDTIIKQYTDKMLKIQSLLYLLSNIDHTSSDAVSYVSQLRNYLYRIIDILTK